MSDHVCSHCGAEDTGSDDWAELDITMAAGARSSRAMSAVPTQVIYRACPACIASDWGSAFRDVLAHPAQRTIEAYERCTVLCTQQPLKRRHRRGQGVLLGRRTRTTCPNCWNKANIEVLNDYEQPPGFLARFLLRTLPDPGKWGKKGEISA